MIVCTSEIYSIKKKVRCIIKQITKKNEKKNRKIRVKIKPDNKKDKNSQYPMRIAKVTQIAVIAGINNRYGHGFLETKIFVKE